jgi:uncharacterized iron-regulated membrane protein
MKLRAAMAAAHNWLGLLLGIQVLLWMLSGAVMSLFDIELVRGRTNAIDAPPPELLATNYSNPGGVIAQTPGATMVTLTHALGRPAYVVAAQGASALFDAETGARLSPLKEGAARAVAVRDFIGAGEITRSALLGSAPHECGCRAPVWRFEFSDRLHTRIYVSPETGMVVARRNDVWRLYDFFWMLHILDFKEREDFNNPLVRTAAVTGTLFAATGLYLVILRLLQGRYRIGRPWRAPPSPPAAADPGS